MIHIIKETEHLIKRKLTDEEKISIMKNINFHKSNLTKDEMIIFLSSKIRQNDKLNQNNIDIHEYQRKTIGIREENDEIKSDAFQIVEPITEQQMAQNGRFADHQEIIESQEKEEVYEKLQTTDINVVDIFGYNLKNLAMLFNPRNLYKKHYLMFDSRYAISNSDRTKFTWMLEKNKIRDIVSIKFFKPSFLRFPIGIDGEFNHFISRRASVLIEELIDQSFKTDGRRFHFIGVNKESIMSDMYAGYNFEDAYSHRGEIDFASAMNYGTYYFHTPITTLDTITLSFGDPFALISFPRIFYPACTYVVPQPNVDYLTIQAYYTIPDNIYEYICECVNFTTSNPTADNELIQRAKFCVNQAGAGSNVFSANTFNIYNFSNQFPIAVGIVSTFDVYISKGRIYANMELTYLDSNIEI